MDWRLVEKRVFRYQRRIYEASKNGNKHAVKGLQKRLVSSFDAKLLSIKRATTNYPNDKNFSKYEKNSITAQNKMNLVSKLRIDGKFHLKKVTNLTKHNLNLSLLHNIENQSKEILCLLALEPEWEAKLEANSYGYRPGRVKQDCLQTIYHYSKTLSKFDCFYILSIKVNTTKIFQNVEKKKVLQKINTYSNLNKQLDIFLQMKSSEITHKKIGVSDENKFEKEKTTLESLLINISLCGLIDNLKKSLEKEQLNCGEIITYGNTILIINKDSKSITKAKSMLELWLFEECGLELKTEKHNIRSSNEGFEFLDHHFITILKNGELKLKMFPSKTSQLKFLSEIRNLIQQNKASSSYHLITLLKPKILKWGNYYRYSDCQKIFRKISHYILQKLRAWVFRRDKRNGRQIVKEKYFPSNKQYKFEGNYYKDNWILNGKYVRNDGKVEEIWLPNMSWIKKQFWIQIINTKSVYDGDYSYWKSRII